MAAAKTAMELMAEDIKAINDCVTRCEKAGVTWDLLAFYIYKETGISLKSVNAVLTALKKATTIK